MHKLNKLDAKYEGKAFGVGCLQSLLLILSVFLHH